MMSFLKALMFSLLGERSIATDAILVFARGCQVMGCPPAVIASEKWAEMKEQEGGQPLTDLTNRLNWNYQSEMLSLLPNFHSSG